MSAAELARALSAGDRRALGRAITLAESTRAEDRLRVEELLALLAGEYTLGVGQGGRVQVRPAG